ncbi:S8 family serine peptidase, partial [Haloferax profundi]|uniref:S8 family serine peptidase n=1 Tax=Haloferax profundi TaxID=1544718 RepID=UPI001E5E9D49
MGSPGASKKALTVGAARYASSDVTHFSSRGPVGFGSDRRAGVDVIAPGEEVISSYPPALEEGSEPYVKMDGTSMAAPHVSGTVALLLDANPDMSLSEVRQTLRSTAQPLPQNESSVGAGMLDAWSAVNATTRLAQKNASTEAGVHELYAGVGNSSDNSVWITREPLVDQLNDVETSPDLRAANPGLLNNGLTIVTHESPVNATFSLYIDADRDNTTGSETGADYRLDIVRRSTENGLTLWTDGYAFNSTSQSFEFTTAISADPDTWDISQNRVRIEGLSFEKRDDAKPFNWYLTASSSESTEKDRFPNKGQFTYGTETVSVPGTAVA